ncbi:carboxypeptidase regulatory-like domain-containing protein [Cryobacterium zhongshanensis]|uniref:alpha-amylase n=1 Tax=Cryobacterium zhongshanensis TaxID=2928153 RepID=A0AA41UFR8_9MICO|nr:carboxypeptidase regulatory-like domain-containing protein [Cryobacterium zhongshanensis]MCI4658250.1 carboxypeptidase regulatory-like domain-containing protein [Cryobacterium zhongshanensis]
MTRISDGVESPNAGGYVYTNSPSDGMSTYAPVDADGHYSLGFLPAGSYTVSFTSSDARFVAEYYDNAPDSASSTSIVVGAGAAIAGIDAVLELGASITGTVTIGTSHAPAADISVFAYTADGSSSVGNSRTDSEGHYALLGMRAGSYKLEFEGSNANGITEWYDNAADISSAKVVVVASQTTVAGIDANLEPGSTITGTVTRNVGNVVSAAPDVRVSVRSATGNYMNQASTDADGHYTIAGLGSGSYTVAFNGNLGSNLLTQYYQNAATASTANPVVIGTGATMSSIDALMQTGAAISGTVTQNDGGKQIAAAQVNVTAYSADNTWVNNVQTDADGAYTLDSLPGGTYKLFFDGESTNAVSEWYKDAVSSSAATAIVVAEHSTVTSINANLEKGSTISGTVTQNVGGTISPAADVTVFAYPTNGTAGTFYGRRTDADGHYTIQALAAGAYAISFSLGDTSSFIPEYYDNASSQSAAKLVQVGVGATVPGINAELQKGGTISGTLTRNDGGTATPLARTSVTAYSSDYQFVATVSTDSTGHYALAGLRAGSYKLHFDGYSSASLSEWYKDATDFASATAVVVGDAAIVSGIDASLDKGGSISGTVTKNVGGIVSPAADVNVMVSTATTGFGNSTTTDASGHYSISTLPAGSYSVKFTGPSASDLVTQYYDNAADQTTSTPVPVGVAASVSGIDAVMKTGATISGTVTRNDSGTATPLANVNVTASSSAAGDWLGSTTTNADGHYSLVGLPSGSYKLNFNGASSDTASEWYNNASNFETATPISLSAQQTVANIDASLEKGSAITGTVTKNVGGTVSPAAGISVFASSSDGNLYGYAMTDDTGHYSVSALNAASYTVQFTDGQNSGLVAEYFDNAATRQAAKPVTVGVAATVSGINAALDAGGTITGTVTKAGSNGTVPSASGYVRVVAADNEESVTYGSTDASGRYSVPGLRAGSYKVVFNSFDTTVVSGKWYRNASDFDSATPVVVRDKATVSGIDENLEKASSLSGTLTQKASGTVSADTSLRASIYSATSGRFVTESTADATGKYTLGSLMAGTYKVGFSGYVSGTGRPSDLVPEFYDNVSDLAAAKPITVGSVQNVTGIDAELSSTALPKPDRLAGEDRFATSSAISANNFDPGVDVVYIASGANFPDALSAAPVAGKDKSPVLLVLPETIPPAVQTELLRLKPKSIVVLGSASSVSDAVAESLKTYTGGTVTRTFGADRFGTSAAISQTAFTPGVPVVYIANGYNFPDALSAAPAAGKDSAPVLLVPTDWVPSEIATELDRLNPGRIVVLGSATSVSEDVKTQMAQYTGGTVTRLAGADRFATSAAVSHAAFPDGASTVYITNGYNFPDALSAAPVAGKKSAPVLLVPADWITNDIKDELVRLKPTRIVVLGGPNSVSDSVEKELAGYIVTP